MSQAAAEAQLAAAAAAVARGELAAAAAAFADAAAALPACAPAWKGLGEARLGLGQPAAAARAFDRAIGLRPTSTTALWGGALAHAELGRTVVARHYLRRALALQPSWITMAQTIPQLRPLLARAGDVAAALRAALGPMSTRRLRHADQPDRDVEVGRLADVPGRGVATYVSLGLCDHAFADAAASRRELLLASSAAAEVSTAIVGNAVFHLMALPLAPVAGAMFDGVVGALGSDGPGARLPHLYLTRPTAWTLPTPLDDGEPPIELLQIVPVSAAERDAWRGLGAAAFEQRLHGVDVADLDRPGTWPPPG